MLGAAAQCSPNDGWCGLGAALLGIAVATLVGAVTYVAAGVVVIRRHRPAGQRAGYVLAHVGAAATILLVALLATGL